MLLLLVLVLHLAPTFKLKIRIGQVFNLEGTQLSKKKYRLHQEVDIGMDTNNLPLGSRLRLRNQHFQDVYQSSLLNTTHIGALYTNYISAQETYMDMPRLPLDDRFQFRNQAIQDAYNHLSRNSKRWELCTQTTTLIKRQAWTCLVYHQVLGSSFKIKLSKVSINHLSQTPQESRFGESFEIFSMINLVINTTFLFFSYVGRTFDQLLVKIFFFFIWLLIKVVHIVSFLGSKWKSCIASKV